MNNWHRDAPSVPVMPYNNLISNQPMTYTITKHIKIEHDEDGWSFDFSTDEYGTVSVKDSAGSAIHMLFIPKDCIPYLIHALEQLK